VTNSKCSLFKRIKLNFQHQCGSCSWALVPHRYTANFNFKMETLQISETTATLPISTQCYHQETGSTLALNWCITFPNVLPHSTKNKRAPGNIKYLMQDIYCCGTAENMYINLMTESLKKLYPFTNKLRGLFWET
jgi:hypothetical protein